jgi:hypothetical protein
VGQGVEERAYSEGISGRQKKALLLIPEHEGELSDQIARQVSPPPTVGCENQVKRVLSMLVLDMIGKHPCEVVPVVESTVERDHVRTQGEERSPDASFKAARLA